MLNLRIRSTTHMLSSSIVAMFSPKYRPTDFGDHCIHNVMIYVSSAPTSRCTKKEIRQDYNRAWRLEPFLFAGTFLAVTAIFVNILNVKQCGLSTCFVSRCQSHPFILSNFLFPRLNFTYFCDFCLERFSSRSSITRRLVCRARNAMTEVGKWTKPQITSRFEWVPNELLLLSGSFVEIKGGLHILVMT